MAGVIQEKEGCAMPAIGADAELVDVELEVDDTDTDEAPVDARGTANEVAVVELKTDEVAAADNVEAGTALAPASLPCSHTVP